jgi:ABC-type transport system involved in cytochrome bd biosynthesis fused ATPase/permease subunit
VPAGILLLVFVVALGIMLPAVSLAAKQAELDALKLELSTYSQVETDYLQKLQEYSVIQEQQKNYTDFVSTGKETLDLLSKINGIKPSTITILSLQFGVEKVVITGYGTKDIEIAKFEIALRNLGMFSEIMLDSITGPDDQRNFSFTLLQLTGIPQESQGVSSSASSQEGSTSK